MVSERGHLLHDPAADPVSDVTLKRSASAASVSELSLRKVLLLTIACYFVYLFTIARLADYHELTRTFGDNTPYVTITTAIKHWDFSKLHIKLFWGLPYAMAALSSATRVSTLNALLAISMLASLITITLAYKTWGGWVSVTFVILSREWLERSLLGGAEPLFLALLLAGFLAARREKWELAALLASLATVVRPMGIFALAGIGGTLLLRKDYRRFAAAITIGLVIGGLYVLPLKLYFGNSLANIDGYDQADWNSQSPIGVPFVAIIQDALTGRATTLNLARTVLWIVFILTSAVMMAKVGALREYAKKCPTEVTFWGLYLIFLFTYNSFWARAEFPRFAIPVVPLSAFALERWIPKSYWLLFTGAVLAAVLSAAETVGIMNAISLLRRAL